MLTQSERLAFCRNCTNRDFNPNHGITCNLTKKPPNFVTTCVDYNEDVKQLVKDAERAQFGNYTITSNNVTPASTGARLGNYFIDRIIIAIATWFFSAGDITMGLIGGPESIILPFAIYLFYYILL
jgi:hypothetical protein